MFEMASKIYENLPFPLYLIKMPFSVQFGPQPTKFLKKLDKQTKERIKKKLLRLTEDPFPVKVERVEGYKGEKVFRVRVGDFRILYLIRYEDKELFVAKIDKRGRVYRM